MANTSLVAALNQQSWQNKFIAEFVTYGGYKPYMSADPSKGIILVINEPTKEASNVVNIPLRYKLRGTEKIGSAKLVGNETQMVTASDKVFITYHRDAVVVDKQTAFPTDLDLWGAAKDGLLEKAGGAYQTELTDCFRSVIVKTGAGLPDAAVRFEDATAAQRNAFLDNNVDRIKFLGGTLAASGNVWATKQNAIVATNKLTLKDVSNAKRAAQQTGNGTSPLAISPYKTTETAGRAWFVLFTGPQGMRDLKAELDAINRDARPREVENNPIFQGGDEIYDGVIIREITDMPLLGTATDGTPVGMSMLCGLNAVATAYGKQLRMTKDVTDYEFNVGVGYELIRGSKKISFEGVQNGVYTIVHAASAD